MSKKIHVPARNTMADTKGRFHILQMSFPQRLPSIAEYIGLIMKNRIIHNAIPEHSDASLATAKGSASITTMVTASHIIIVLFSSIKEWFHRLNIPECLCPSSKKDKI